ncbi:phosphatidate cytidylyltransferase [Streptococcus sp. E29BA]|uniref:phosphatidate cytidylyltransferase n=1 Tax=Streptococcus sp. E29BA TaxID=3278716 RepID=UPI00359DC22B
MQQRMIYGAIAAAIFLPILILGGLPLHLLLGGLAMLAVAELFKMKGLEPFSFEGALATLGAFVLTVPLGHYFSALPLQANVSALTVIAFIILAGMVFTFPNYRFEDAAFAIAASFYMGIGFHHLVLARLAGIEHVLFVLFIIWATDIGAYMIGSRFGKRRLAPQISPNKSIEGFLGGILSAMLIAAIFILIRKTVTPYSLLGTLPLIALFSAVAQFGDLVESAIKRHYGVKDSGKLIPGHGGVFDRFDSVIFVLPLMHFFGLF